MALTNLICNFAKILITNYIYYEILKNYEDVSKSISKFVHGIAYNAWTFAQKPEKIYLSGGFCENECFVNSLKKYCDVILLGRFVLCEGLIDE